MKHLSDSNFNNNQLDNVPTPTNAGDATNKEYVDTSISSISKSSIGLGNVDNTSDVDKPISAATQAALDDRLLKIESVATVKDYGALGDGVNDDTAAFTDALAANTVVIVPRGTYRVTDTIIVRSGKELRGYSKTQNSFGSTDTVILYDGVASSTKTVVQVGLNTVGAEPTSACTGAVVKDLTVDANNKAGFSLYGTYLTNGTIIDSVVLKGSTEYGGYIARSWYASFTNIRALLNSGNGLAFGMPLRYMDDSLVAWTTIAPVEVNNALIQNIRAHSNGRYFSVINPGTYNPATSNYNKGYGVGIGEGNSMNVTSVTSEASGGCNLYVYNGPNVGKKITQGYLEDAAKNSGLDPASTMANMIIEDTANSGGGVEISDIFMNYFSGGIFCKGLYTRPVYLRRVRQPRFLSSLSGESSGILFSHIIKDQVYEGAGYYNTNPRNMWATEIEQEVDTRYSWNVPVAEKIPHWNAIYMKSDGTVPWGSYSLEFSNGSTASRAFPAGLTTEYQLVTVQNGFLKNIKKAGGTGATPAKVSIMVKGTPVTTE